MLAPMTVQEAVLSSRIEGTQATLGDVYLFESGVDPLSESSRQDVQEIINYRNALLFAESKLDSRPFNLNLLRSLHNILLGSVRGLYKARGEVRREQNWIGPPGCTAETADFVPPRWEALPGFLGDWESYYHSEQPDALVHLGVLHAQFEALHPFLDGNGRIGRLLVPLFLYEKRILSRPMFYISAYLERHREEYIGHLREIGRNSKGWQNWTRFFLNAITEQSRENTNKARQIIDLYEQLKKQLINVTHSQYAVPLLDAMFSKPIFQISHLYDNPHLPSKQMINTLVSRLKAANILKVMRTGKGRQAQVLALATLVNLCEGRNVI